MGKMASWFNKKLSPDQISSVYDRIQHIPDGPFQEIVDQIIDEKAPNPGNFPTINQLKNAWYTWRNSNPDRVAVRETVLCDVCLGHGILWFLDFNEKLQSNHEWVVRCGRCDNWRKHFATDCKSPKLITRFELESKDINVWPYIPEDYKSPKINVKEMIDNIGVPF